MKRMMEYLASGAAFFGGIAVAVVATVVTACGRVDGYVPQEGDLLFLVGGESAFSEAIVDATAWEDSVKFDHVAIVAVDEDGGAYVIEARGDMGVVRTQWDDFFEVSPSVEKPADYKSAGTIKSVGEKPADYKSAGTIKSVGEKPADCKSAGTDSATGTGRGVIVKRVKGEFPASEAVRRAESYIGQPYDWSYYPDNGKMYCSELVWECFRWEDGSRIFTAKPMNFRDSDGNMPEFWVELYEKLGEPIPEGVLGTNPNDMFKDPVLTEVYRFF